MFGIFAKKKKEREEKLNKWLEGIKNQFEDNGVRYYVNAQPIPSDDREQQKSESEVDIFGNRVTPASPARWMFRCGKCSCVSRMYTEPQKSSEIFQCFGCGAYNVVEFTPDLFKSKSGE